MQDKGLQALSPYEIRTVTALFERLFPGDDSSPGAEGIGVTTYLDRTLAGPYRDKRDVYRLGLRALDGCAQRQWGKSFDACTGEQRAT